MYFPKTTRDIQNILFRKGHKTKAPQDYLTWMLKKVNQYKMCPHCLNWKHSSLCKCKNFL